MSMKDLKDPQTHRMAPEVMDALDRFYQMSDESRAELLVRIMSENEVIESTARDLKAGVPQSDFMVLWIANVLKKRGWSSNPNEIAQVFDLPIDFARAVVARMDLLPSAWEA